jgi:ribosomal protein S13
MSYNLGTNLVSNEQIEIALTRIFGIGLKKEVEWSLQTTNPSQLKKV